MIYYIIISYIINPFIMWKFYIVNEKVKDVRLSHCILMFILWLASPISIIVTLIIWLIALLPIADITIWRRK